jgi:hypothetical protein
VSGTILVGSSDGHIFEAVLDVNEKGIVKVWKPVFNIETGNSIDGLTWERLSATRFYAIAATPSRLFEFQVTISIKLIGSCNVCFDPPSLIFRAMAPSR